MVDWFLNTPMEMLTIFTKSFILGVWLDSRYSSDMFQERQNNCEIPVKESFLETKKVFLKKLLRKTLIRNNFLHSYFWQVLQEIPEQLYSKRVLLYLLNEMPLLPEFSIFSQFLQLHQSCELNLSCWVFALSWLFPSL